MCCHEGKQMGDCTSRRPTGVIRSRLAGDSLCKWVSANSVENIQTTHTSTILEKSKINELSHSHNKRGKKKSGYHRSGKGRVAGDKSRRW